MSFKMQFSVFLGLAFFVFLPVSGVQAAACDNQKSEAERMCLSKEIRKKNQSKTDFSYRNQCEAKADDVYRECLAGLKTTSCEPAKKFIEATARGENGLHGKLDEGRRGGLNLYQALVRAAGGDDTSQDDLIRCKEWAKSFLNRVSPSDVCDAARKDIDHILNNDLELREAFEDARQKGQAAWPALISQTANPKNLHGCPDWASVYMTRNVGPIVAIILPKQQKKKAEEKAKRLKADENEDKKE